MPEKMAPIAMNRVDRTRNVYYFVTEYMNKIACIIAGALLCGCMSMDTWVTSVKTDPFTDVTTKTVSMNFVAGDNGWNKLVFFVSSHTNDVFLGVRSTLGIPVGTVQIRIDQNPAITISPSETPVYMAPTVSTNAPYSDMTAQVMAGMSPFTATTGDKAHTILKQMVHGKTLIYRTVAINQQASTTGMIKLDPSFAAALKTIGINPDNL